MDKIKQLVIPSLKFHTGRSIPQIGLGTYQNRGDTCVESVKIAVKNGYRHIDTASGYQNGHDIARALDDLYSEKIVQREDLFITSKIAPSEQGYDNALKACDNILKGLKTSYLDLLIIHWPGATGSVSSQDVPKVRLETWRALEKLKSEGKVKDIGVSNFLERHLDHLLENSKTKPVLNQFELHPLCHNKQLVEYCKKRDIVVEAYSSLARMDPILIKNEYLELVGKKYGKTVAQVALRWGLQNGFVILPKSKTEKYIIDNIKILDFELSEHEMEKMNSMNGNYHTCWNPESVKY